MPVRYACDLRQIVRSTPWFLDLLRAARACDPPDWLIGGGVIRTLVWDHLHGHRPGTALRDVDLAFFDPEDLRPARERALEAALRRRIPEAPWQAKNQAAVHLWYASRFGYPVAPLTSCAEAPGRKRPPAWACASRPTTRWRSWLPSAWTTCST